MTISSWGLKRPRRLRVNATLREMVQDVYLMPKQLVYPIFVDETITRPEEIKAMPDQYRWPLLQIEEPVRAALKSGVKAFMLFGVPKEKTDDTKVLSETPNIVCKALERLKEKCPEAYLITDLCLCAYITQGHCGFLSSDGGMVLNDKTVDVLKRMAELYCRYGADMVAPSGMMDWQIRAIREWLDEHGFEYKALMAYSTKFASSFYGPFREAAQSAPKHGDRKSYQMDFRCKSVLRRQLETDYEGGADILMVKPALPYLDVVKEAAERFSCPIAAYHVSGEYSMIKAAAMRGFIDEKAIVLESFYAMRRAGACIIISYYAPQAAKWLEEEIND